MDKKNNDLLVTRSQRLMIYRYIMGKRRIGEDKRKSRVSSRSVREWKIELKE